ncbi:class I SAM-dependent methyltransferase [Brooklawnia cerclae]|uniref:SAM-dependent methyltransferase n=1 Tax=Brooklawnia cerclae TaxID=349934 RepID=A0ABX0SI91_9ACTN|nr:class I SAM-dependent methyltransferase [Brooklawnia cerclae]NIH58115.1 SAM-dependent methyltransferase [Brooklawnia cerclae]
MTEPEPTSARPDDLLARWDAQQAAYIRHRDLRFDTMARVVGLLGRSTPRVLDLACGPGSLTRFIRDRFPGSSVVAVDKDPLLLAVARDVFADDPQVMIANADLDEAAWAASAPGPFDAVVSSTALHWLEPDVLVRLYFELADLIAPGGVFLNGDHFAYDPAAQPTLLRIAADDDAVTQQAAFDAGADTWDHWWEVAAARPGYSFAATAREHLWEGNHTAPKVTLGFHLETLRSAGFSEVGTVWQYLDDYVVAAVR